LTHGWWALLLATLIVGVRCSGTITGERERQTWDGLMMTPLTVQEVVRGKLRGILRSTWPYLLAFWFGTGLVAGFTADDPRLMLVALVLVPAVGGLLALQMPAWRAWFATGMVVLVAATGGLDAALIVAVSLGVTWLAMYFLGAVGLYWSARSQSSWRSLVGTLALGYAGGFALFCVASPVGCISAMIFTLIASAIKEALEVTGGASRPTWFWELAPLFGSIGVAAVFWLVARSIVMAAETTVAKSDRIAPNWVRMIEFDLPRYIPRRPRRRLPR
jgi:hypothetical protein